MAGRKTKLTEREKRTLVTFYKKAIEDITDKLGPDFWSDKSNARLTLLLEESRKALVELDANASAWVDNVLAKLYAGNVKFVRDKVVTKVGKAPKAMKPLIHKEAVKAAALDPTFGITPRLRAASAHIGQTIEEFVRRRKTLKAQATMVSNEVAKGIALGLSSQDTRNNILDVLLRRKPANFLALDPEVSGARSLLDAPYLKVPLKNGGTRRMHIFDHVQMTATTMENMVRTMARRNELVGTGIKLAQISPHPPLTPCACSLFAGRIVSLTQLAEKSTGYPYIGRLPGGGPPFHPYCTHSILPWFPGLMRPEEEVKAHAVGTDDQTFEGRGIPTALLDKDWATASEFIKKQGGIDYAVRQNPALAAMHRSVNADSNVLDVLKKPMRTLATKSAIDELGLTADDALLVTVPGMPPVRQRKRDVVPDSGMKAVVDSKGPTTTPPPDQTTTKSTEFDPTDAVKASPFAPATENPHSLPLPEWINEDSFRDLWFTGTMHSSPPLPHPQMYLWFEGLGNGLDDPNIAVEQWNALPLTTQQALLSLRQRLAFTLGDKLSDSSSARKSRLQSDELAYQAFAYVVGRVLAHKLGQRYASEVGPGSPMKTGENPFEYALSVPNEDLDTDKELRLLLGDRSALTSDLDKRKLILGDNRHLARPKYSLTVEEFQKLAGPNSDGFKEIVNLLGADPESGIVDFEQKHYLEDVLRHHAPSWRRAGLSETSTYSLFGALARARDLLERGPDARERNRLIGRPDKNVYAQLRDVFNNPALFKKHILGNKDLAAEYKSKHIKTLTRLLEQAELEADLAWDRSLEKAKNFFSPEMEKDYPDWKKRFIARSKDKDDPQPLFNIGSWPKEVRSALQKQRRQYTDDVVEKVVAQLNQWTNEQFDAMAANVESAKHDPLTRNSIIATQLLDGRTGGNRRWRSEEDRQEYNRQRELLLELDPEKAPTFEMKEDMRARQSFDKVSEGAVGYTPSQFDALFDYKRLGTDGPQIDWERFRNSTNLTTWQMEDAAMVWLIEQGLYGDPKALWAYIADHRNTQSPAYKPSFKKRADGTYEVQWAKRRVIAMNSNSTPDEIGASIELYTPHTQVGRSFQYTARDLRVDQNATQHGVDPLESQEQIEKRLANLEYKVLDKKTGRYRVINPKDDDYKLLSKQIMEHQQLSRRHSQLSSKHLSEVNNRWHAVTPMNSSQRRPGPNVNAFLSQVSKNIPTWYWTDDETSKAYGMLMTIYNRYGDKGLRAALAQHPDFAGKADEIDNWVDGFEKAKNANNNNWFGYNDEDKKALEIPNPEKLDQSGFVKDEVVEEMFQLMLSIDNASTSSPLDHGINRYLYKLTRPNEQDMIWLYLHGHDPRARRIQQEDPKGIGKGIGKALNWDGFSDRLLPLALDSPAKPTGGSTHWLAQGGRLPKNSEIMDAIERWVFRGKDYTAKDTYLYKAMRRGAQIRDIDPKYVAQREQAYKDNPDEIDQLSKTPDEPDVQVTDDGTYLANIYNNPLSTVKKYDPTKAKQLILPGFMNVEYIAQQITKANTDIGYEKPKNWSVRKRGYWNNRRDLESRVWHPPELSEHIKRWYAKRSGDYNSRALLSSGRYGDVDKMADDMARFWGIMQESGALGSSAERYVKFNKDGQLTNFDGTELSPEQREAITKVLDNGAFGQKFWTGVMTGKSVEDEMLVLSVEADMAMRDIAWALKNQAMTRQGQGTGKEYILKARTADTLALLFGDKDPEDGELRYKTTKQGKVRQRVMLSADGTKILYADGTPLPAAAHRLISDIASSYLSPETEKDLLVLQTLVGSEDEHVHPLLLAMAQNRMAVTGNKSHRAWADMNNHMVSLSASDFIPKERRVVGHEMLHHVESHSEYFANLMRRFMLERVGRQFAQTSYPSQDATDYVHNFTLTNKTGETQLAGHGMTTSDLNRYYGRTYYPDKDQHLLKPLGALKARFETWRRPKADKQKGLSLTTKSPTEIIDWWLGRDPKEILEVLSITNTYDQIVDMASKQNVEVTKEEYELWRKNTKMPASSKDIFPDYNARGWVYLVNDKINDSNQSYPTPRGVERLVQEAERRWEQYSKGEAINYEGSPAALWQQIVTELSHRSERAAHKYDTRATNTDNVSRRTETKYSIKNKRMGSRNHERIGSDQRLSARQSTEMLTMVGQHIIETTSSGSTEERNRLMTQDPGMIAFAIGAMAGLYSPEAQSVEPNIGYGRTNADSLDIEENNKKQTNESFNASDDIGAALGKKVPHHHDEPQRTVNDLKARHLYGVGGPVWRSIMLGEQRYSSEDILYRQQLDLLLEWLRSNDLAMGEHFYTSENMRAETPEEALARLMAMIDEQGGDND